MFGFSERSISNILFWITRKKWLILTFILSISFFYFPTPDGLSSEGHRTLIIVLVALSLIVSETIPLPAVALLILIMEVVLLEKIGRLGDIGDTVKVKAGFGRNFLVPQGKAVYATKKNLEVFESRRADLEKQEAEKLKVAQERSEKIASVGAIKITAVVGEEGKLFGSVGAREIEEAINLVGGEVSKNEINLPDGAYKQVGEYSVDIQLHSDVTVSVGILIESE